MINNLKMFLLNRTFHNQREKWGHLIVNKDQLLIHITTQNLITPIIPHYVIYGVWISKSNYFRFANPIRCLYSLTSLS